MKLSNKLKGQGGFTLAELTICIAIIVIVLGAYAVKGGWLQSAKATGTTQQIKRVQQAASQWKTQKAAADYTGLTLATLQGLNLVGASDGNNKFGNAITAAPIAGTESVLQIETTVPTEYGDLIADALNEEYGAGACTNTAGAIDCQLTAP